MDLGFQLPRLPAVVRIEQGNQLSPRLPQAEVARRTDSSVGLVEVAHRWAAALDHALGVVGGAVVCHNNLDGPIRLLEDALHGLGQGVRAVVRRMTTLTRLGSPGPSAIFAASLISPLRSDGKALRSLISGSRVPHPEEQLVGPLAGFGVSAEEGSHVSLKRAGQPA